MSQNCEFAHDTLVDPSATCLCLDGPRGRGGTGPRAEGRQLEQPLGSPVFAAVFAELKHRRGGA